MQRVSFSQREQSLAETQARELTSLNLSNAAPAVLDIGCADLRRYSMECAAISASYAGLDVDLGTLQSASNKISAEPVLLVNGSAESLPWRENSFDLVLANDMLAYCNKPLVLAEALRVLKPSGVLLCLHNNSIGWSLYKLVYPEKPRLLEWAHSAVVILNTIFYRATGMRFFHTTFSTANELHRQVVQSGFEIIRAQSTKTSYTVHHIVARKPTR